MDFIRDLSALGFGQVAVGSAGMRLSASLFAAMAALLVWSAPEARAAAVGAGTEPWRDGVVRVHLAQTIKPGDPKYRQLDRAIRAWREATGLRIELTTANRPPMLYVFDNGRGQCDSTLGRSPRAQRGGTTKVVNGAALNLGKCSDGSVLHEVGHALGLMHEHQRADALTFLSLSPIRSVLQTCSGNPAMNGCREAVANVDTRRPLRLASDFDPCSLMMYLADQSPKSRTGRYPKSAGWGRFYLLTRAGQANFDICRVLMRPDPLCRKTGQKCEISCQDANTVAVFHGLRPRVACWGRGPLRGR